MLGLSADFRPGVGLAWWITKGPSRYKDREGISISFSLSRAKKTREALETVEEYLRLSKCEFIIRESAAWKVDLDALKKSHPDWAEIEWMQGRISIVPDVDVVQEQSRLGTVNSTVINFMLFREDIEKCNQESAVESIDVGFGFSATVITVMIASPGDVQTERDAIRGVIHEWNAIHARDRKVVLLPTAWETNSAPSMDDRAQGVLNKQLLSNCDLLVGVFWSRLGTPTGTSKSGTVEEIETHLAKGRPALIYFSRAPIPQHMIDDKQRRALHAFEESLRPRGLLHDYDDVRDFKSDFSRHLSITMNEKFVRPVAVNDSKVPVAGKKPIRLSSEAARILVAARDSDGHIMRVETLDGTSIQAGNQDLVDSEDPRVVASWIDGFEELLTLKMIQDLGMGTVFRVTKAGYSFELEPSH
jgi:hypothetical protein